MSRQACSLEGKERGQSGEHTRLECRGWRPRQPHPCISSTSRRGAGSNRRGQTQLKFMVGTPRRGVRGRLGEPSLPAADFALKRHASMNQHNPLCCCVLESRTAHVRLVLTEKTGLF